MDVEKVIRVLSVHRDQLVVFPTIIPHSEFGGKNCLGSLTGIRSGELAEIICNECGDMIAYVAGDLRQFLNEMELRLELATGQCEHCGSVNLFPGLSRVATFFCQMCGARTLNQASAQGRPISSTAQ